MKNIAKQLLYMLLLLLFGCRSKDTAAAWKQAMQANLALQGEMVWRRYGNDFHKRRDPWKDTCRQELLKYTDMLCAGYSGQVYKPVAREHLAGLDTLALMLSGLKDNSFLTPDTLHKPLHLLAEPERLLRLQLYGERMEALVGFHGCYLTPKLMPETQLLTLPEREARRSYALLYYVPLPRPRSELQLCGDSCYTYTVPAAERGAAFHVQLPAGIRSIRWTEQLPGDRERSLYWTLVPEKGYYRLLPVPENTLWPWLRQITP